MWVFLSTDIGRRFCGNRGFYHPGSALRASESGSRRLSAAGSRVFRECGGNSLLYFGDRRRHGFLDFVTRGRVFRKRGGDGLLYGRAYRFLYFVARGRYFRFT